VYVVATTLAFAIAAGVGAMGALLLRGDLGLPGADKPQPADEQQYTPGTQQSIGAAQQKEDASQESAAEYVARVGDIQANSVETFLDRHNIPLRYDALTADGVEEMQGNQDALQGFTEKVGNLNPPQKYEEQYETFSYAMRGMYAAVRQAYNLAADPTATIRSGFDKYNRHVNEAAGLQRSNELLGRAYKTIGDVRKVNLLS
jgi:hypothetical protein